MPSSDADSVTSSLFDAAMGLAIEAAEDALRLGDLPIGAVVLGDGGDVLSCRHDEVASAGDPTAHASVLALRDAAGKLGSWRLSTVTLIVTLEPCALCAGAALAARVARVVIGVRDPTFGALGSRYNFGADPRLNHEFPITEGVLAPRCADLADRIPS